MSDYDAFIASKTKRRIASGFEPYPIKAPLFDWQKAVVRWAVRNGCAALFEECGLGKTLQQLEWARQVAKKTGAPVLILTPLCVAHQTATEAGKFGIKANVVAQQSDVTGAGIWITNYEKLDHFEPSAFAGVVLDESSILKAFTGKTRKTLTDAFSKTPYRLCCTATPSPNDYTELGQHADFLGVCSPAQMLATFFVNDTFNTGDWRLKKHAEGEFWKWIASWACCVSKPSDIGFSDEGYDLPTLHMHTETVDVDEAVGAGEELFRHATLSATTIHAEMRLTSEARARRVAERVAAEPGEQWLVWCNTNDEADKLKEAIPDCVEVRGSDTANFKEKAFDEFLAGKIRVLVSKASIFGFGMNAQCCARVAFVGLSYSFEDLYQALRRSYRFGQTREVHVYIVQARTEGAILQTIQRKIEQHKIMQQEMKRASAVFAENRIKELTVNSDIRIMTGQGWKLAHADCVRFAKTIPDESIDFSVFSPPFADLFTYSDDLQDMGNCADISEFTKHFELLIAEMARIMVPGREIAVHCADILSTKWKHGRIEFQDFSGELVRAFWRHGFLFHSRICIWKSPVTEMQRTKAHGLLYKTLKADSTDSRVGCADYLLVFRKPGDNPRPVIKDPSSFPVELWQEYASPVWMTIDQGNVLNGEGAREKQDERHICLSAGSLVLTREYGYLEIEHVEVGDRVLTHQGRWKPVLAKKCNGIAETVRVCGQGVADLRLTPNHLIWARMAKGSRPKEGARDSDPVWAEASTVLGSYLNLRLPPKEPSLLTKNEWWIVGRWLGDGHRGGHRRSGVRGGLGQFYISCAHTESDALIGRLGVHAGHAAKITATQIALIGLRPEVRDVLNRCGEGASNKRLPGEAVTLDAKLAASLLDGYLSADGHYVEKHNRHMASSVSRALLLGMAILAQRARGVVASVYAGRPEREGEIQGRRVSMLQDWIFAFRASDGHHKSGWIDRLGAWKKVRKIEIAGEAEVWDLKVADDESFTTEGCVVHNCPLQKDVIERAVILWSNPGDLVYSPFTGIGSEGYMALKLGRRFVGSELKNSYCDVAKSNLDNATSQAEFKLSA